MGAEKEAMAALRAQKTAAFFDLEAVTRTRRRWNEESIRTSFFSAVILGALCISLLLPGKLFQLCYAERTTASWSQLLFSF